MSNKIAWQDILMPRILTDEEKKVLREEQKKSKMQLNLFERGITPDWYEGGSISTDLPF